MRPADGKLDPSVVDVKGLVKWFKHIHRKVEFRKPDFWVQLLDGTEVEVECKNWKAKPKPMPNRFGSTWVYRWNDHTTTSGYTILGCSRKFEKDWSPGCRKVLLLSRMDIFDAGAQRELSLSLIHI